MTKKNPMKSWEPGRGAGIVLALVMTAPVIWMYLAGPNNRIFSFHGFVHVAIANQAALGHVPPEHPFLAGQPLLYHWGYHCLGAWISRTFHFSPFWAFAVINLVSLFCAAVLLYALAGLLTKKRWARLLSVSVCLYALTPFPHVSLALKENLPFPLDERSIHPILKYCNMNAVPLGMVFFLLFLCGLAGLFAGSRISWKHAVMLLAGVVGTAFFYPPFTIGIGATFLLMPCLYFLSRMIGWALPDGFLPRFAIAAAAAGIGGLLLYPYLQSISGGIRESMQYGLPKEGAIKLAGCLLIYGAPLIVIFSTRRGLRKITASSVRFVLLTVALANLAAFLVLNQHLGTEYKYRLLFAVPLGLVTGLAFYTLLQRKGRGWIALILAFFCLPSGFVLVDRSRNHGDIESMVIESGGRVTHRDKEEQELHAWIEAHTDPDAVFLDSRATLPVFARRSLFVLPPKVNPLGLDVNFDFFFKGDDRKLIRQRRGLLKGLASSDYALCPKDRTLIAGFEDRLYRVTRYRTDPEPPNPGEWEKVFTSSLHNLSVFKLKLLEPR